MMERSPLAVETLPFRRLLDEAMVRVRGSWRRLFLPLAVISGTLTATGVVLNVLFFDVVMMGAGTTPEPDMGRGCLYYLASLGISLLTFYLYVVSFVGALDCVAGRPVRLGRRAVDLLRPAIFGTLLLTAFLIGLSYAACCLPVLFVGPLLIFTLPVIFEEDMGGSQALGRASRLARHNPAGELLTHPMFKLFVLFFVGTLLSFAVSMVSQLPLQMSLQWEMFQSMDSQGAGTEPGGVRHLLWLHVPLAFLGGGLVAGVTLYQGFGLALIFFDTRERKEGRDLEVAIERVEEERQRRRGESIP